MMQQHGGPVRVGELHITMGVVIVIMGLAGYEPSEYQKSDDDSTDAAAKS